MKYQDFSSPIQPFLPNPALYSNNTNSIGLLKDYTNDQERDQEIVQQCIRSDRRSQQKLFDLYKEAMYTICYRMAKDGELAEDILQEAFLQVFNNLKSFQFRSTLGAWIKTIVIRTAIRKLKEEVILERLDDIPNNQLTELPGDLTGHDLEKAIISLPAGYRAVFLLIEVEGYKHKEVAEMLSISEGTSKSQLHYARQLLQVKLKAFSK